MSAHTLRLVDSAAIIGFVAALLGAAVGALGTYYATVQAALAAIQEQVHENVHDVAQARKRLKKQYRQLTQLDAGLRAVQAGRLYEVNGQAISPDSGNDLERLLEGRLDLGVAGLSASVWTPLLAPDAAFVKPQLYSALVSYEAYLDAIRDLTRQALPTMFDLAQLMAELETPTLQELAAGKIQGVQAVTVVRRLLLHVEALYDLFTQLETHLPKLLTGQVTTTSTAVSTPA